jgi:hypothetical protein
MVFVEMRPILSIEMGNETFQHTKRAFEHLRKPRPKIFSRTYTKVE